MRLKTLFTAVPALSLLVAAGACDDGLTEVNRNPNSPEDVPVETILASGILRAVDSPAGYGAFSEWSMLRHTGLWTQYLAEAQYNDEDHYIPRPGVPTNIWDNFYAGTLTDLYRVRQIAEEQGDDNLWAVAEIMSVYDFLFLTDLYGDIPYSEVQQLEEGNRNPKYDAQKDIYPDLLRRLKAAADRINPSVNVGFEEGDLIYGGNMQEWKEFANSLRLRIAMRMADTELSAEARTEFAAAWQSDIFDSVEDNADLDFTADSPLYDAIIAGGRTGDFRASATVVNLLKDLNDPRLAIYVDPAISDGEYRGLPNGLTPDEVTLNGKAAGSGDFSWIGSYFLQPTTPAVLMSYAEVLFLGAEAAQRGWITANAADLYRQAVTASLRQYNVSQAQIDAYLAQPEVAFSGLESIGVQKWLALYMAGPEGFNEFRRTGFPDLELSAHAELDDFPARLPYPTEEALYNPDNYKEVPLTERLWWDRTRPER